MTVCQSFWRMRQRSRAQLRKEKAMNEHDTNEVLNYLRLLGNEDLKEIADILTEFKHNQKGCFHRLAISFQAVSEK